MAAALRVAVGLCVLALAGPTSDAKWSGVAGPVVALAVACAMPIGAKRHGSLCRVDSSGAKWPSLPLHWLM